ncbi:hypothetical protein THC_1204 [Caldimicrobium thiodismutans]|uniref:PIN domain-containing protein n=1 Tax=Caldimicrobium thiodismutans TaxID=1653476 RepID=A0A0U5AI56_9BACT|nr:hypothetical protein THC_1204 [Caldimicrobium thiodismutans]
MYLIDTNIILELLLNQTRSDVTHSMSHMIINCAFVKKEKFNKMGLKDFKERLGERRKV